MMRSYSSNYNFNKAYLTYSMFIEVHLLYLCSPEWSQYVVNNFRSHLIVAPGETLNQSFVMIDVMAVMRFSVTLVLD